MAILNKYLNNKFFKTLEPLSGLSADKLSELVNKSNVETIPAGRTLFRQGDKDKHSYYLLSGQIELHTSGENKTQTIKAKTPEAKYPIAQQLPRPYTARIKLNSEVLSIDTSLLEMLLESDGNPSSGAYEVTEISSEDENGWMLKFLQSRAFLQIPTDNIQKILMSMEEVKANKGESIVTQGESNDFYYIVKSGKCSVSRRPSPNAEDVQIAILAAGDGFGEEALITEGHRNATVRMVDDGVLMRLTKEDFISLLVKPLLDYIHIDELKSRVSAGDLLVDVRQHKDFMAAHLDGAVNTPLSMIRLKLNTFNTERNVIVYCNDASRSTAAAFLLIQNGLSCSILKDGLNSHAAIQSIVTSTSASKENVVAKSAAETRTPQSIPVSNSPIAPLPTLKKPVIPADSTTQNKVTVQTEKRKKQIDELNKKKLQTEVARQQAEARLEQQKKIESERNTRLLKQTERNRLQEAERAKQAIEEKQRLELEKLNLQEETKNLKQKAEEEKIAAQKELKKLREEYNKHKQAIEAKDLAEKETQALLERAAKEKQVAERELERQAEESRKNRLIIEDQQRAERAAQELRLKAESEKLAAERELQKQKEFVTRQLEKQQKITEESQRQVKIETDKIRQQADKELAQLREELEKTKNSVEERVRDLKEKESLLADEEIRSRKQHANDAIRESIEKARHLAEAEAAKVREQALIEVQGLQKNIELRKQKLETEAKNIRLEAERDRAATLESARKQAQEIVFKTTEQAKFINIRQQELDNDAVKIQLQIEAERHATLESAKLEASNIIRKTAEEVQLLDLQRQKIEAEVTRIKSEAESEKEKTIRLAHQDANKIRSEAERISQLQAQKELELIRNKTLQQTKELKQQRERIKLQAQKELEHQRSTMELSLQQAEKIRIQAEKEAEQVRLKALQSALSVDKETTIPDISSPSTNTIDQQSSEVSFSNINIPGPTTSSKSPMIESQAQNLAQEIVSKLEKAESNRIKEQHETSNNNGNGISLSSASLKRRSDGKIILEGDEDLFIFKEPKEYTEEELNEFKKSLEGSRGKNTNTVHSLLSEPIKTTTPFEFSFDEPDFDLVDELPNNSKAQQNTGNPISEFSDFELHQPSDMRAQVKPALKRPAQRIIAIAASLFVAVGVGITFVGVNSEQSKSQNITMKKDNSFNATRVSGLAASNIEIDKKIMSEAEREFEKLLSKWKKSQDKQDVQKNTNAIESLEKITQ